VRVSWMPDSQGVAMAGPADLVHRGGISFVVFERKTRAELCRLPKSGLIAYRTVRLLEREGIVPSILDFVGPHHSSPPVST
jgi:hypothetical protein